MLSYIDVQYFLAIRLLLIAFLAIGVLLLFRAKKQQYGFFLLITGIMSAASYYLLVSETPLLLWGIEGDEVTISAMYRTFVEGNFLSDFAYPALPSFHPPLFFWLFGGVGMLLGLNSILTAKFAVVITLLCFPVAAYLIQHGHWKHVQSDAKKHLPGKFAWFLLPLFILVLISPDAMITKPYQLITAMGTVFWTVALLIDLHEDRWSWKRMFIYGISAGLLFMTYYLWLIYAAITISLSGLFVKKKHQIKYYARLIGTAILSLIVALPYLGPLVAAYQTYGTEQWPAAFYTLGRSAWYAPMVTLFSWQGVLLLAALSIMIIYRTQIYVRSLLLLYVSGYIWYTMGIVGVLFAAAPMQEFKPFSFYSLTIAAFALAYGAERSYAYVQKKHKRLEWKLLLGIVGLIFLSTHMIFGRFIDDPVVHASRLHELKPTEAALIEFLADEGSTKYTVTPGIGEIYAFAMVHSYIYYNQHNAHPASQFSDRYASLLLTQFATSSQALHTAALSATHGPIERFILFKNTGLEDYSAHMHVDNFPNGSRDARFGFKKELFAAPYFELVYENDEFVVWDTVLTSE